MNLGAAFVLLAAYAIYLVFLLKAHPDYFESVTITEVEQGREGRQWSVGRAIASLLMRRHRRRE